MIRSPHAEAQLIIGHLAEVGCRRAGSPQEATAAAFVNARLRRVGMGVATQPLQITARRRHLFAAAAASGLFAALTAVLLPIPALALALATLAVLLLDTTIGPLIAFGPTYSSQTIVGTKEIAAGTSAGPCGPLRRVVLLAPLDSPMVMAGIAALAGPSWPAALTRIGALLIVALAALLDQLQPSRGWVLLAIPATILLALQLVAALRGPRPDRGDGGTGALATMLLAAQRLRELKRIELWAVALGATALDSGGLDELLQSYPFERTQTLVISLEQLTSGRLCYQTISSDPDQVGGAHIAAAAQSLAISLEARTSPAQLSLAAALRRHKLPTLALYSHAPRSPSPRRADPQLSEDAAQLIAAIIAQLEA